MSFDKIVNKDYAPKVEEFKVKTADGAEFSFIAKEIPFLQRLSLDGVSKAGGDWTAKLISLSIEDADGKHLEPEQVNAISPEVVVQLFNAAAKVNGLLNAGGEEAEKN